MGELKGLPQTPRWIFCGKARGVRNGRKGNGRGEKKEGKEGEMETEEEGEEEREGNGSGPNQVREEINAPELFKNSLNLAALTRLLDNFLIY